MPTQEDFDKLRLKLNNFSQARTKLDELHHLLRPTFEPDKMEKEFDDVVGYQDKIDGQVFKIERFFFKHNVDTRTGSVSGLILDPLAAGTSGLQGRGGQSLGLRGTSGNSLFKLPQLEIQPFEGDYLQWSTFWDQFVSAVGNSTDVPPAAKLQFLVSLLRGQPLDMVRNLNFTDENYDLALQALRERYASSKVLKSLHYQALFQFQPLPEECELREIRLMETEVSKHVNVLLRLSADHEALYEKVEKLFPLSFLRRFVEDERIEPSPDNITTKTVTELLKFVRTELNLRESWKPIASVYGLGSLRPSMDPKTYVEKYTTASALLSTDRANLTPVVKTQFGTQINENRQDRTFCVFCQTKDHWGRTCMAPRSLKSKIAMLLAKSRCTQCLKPGHIARECSFPYRLCERCNGMHFVVVCTRHPYANLEDEVKVTDPVPVMQTCQLLDEMDELVDEDDDPEQVSIHFVSSQKKPVVLMPTAEVSIGGPVKWEDAVCLLDSGSQRTFLLKEVSDNLQLPVMGQENLKIEGFAASQTDGIFPRVSLALRGAKTNQAITIEALVVPKLTNYCPQQMSPAIVRVWNSLKLRGLLPADTRRGTPTRQLKLIIGADYINLVNTGRSCRVGKNLLASETSFGWTLQGVLPQKTIVPSQCQQAQQDLAVTVVSCSFIQTEFQEDEKLETVIKRFWELESIGIKEEEVLDDLVDFRKQFQDKLSFDGKNYSVGLPWFRSKQKALQSNRDGALLRYKSTVSRLLKCPQAFNQYNNAITAYLTDGYAEEVEESKVLQPARPIFYLPHHPIIDESRSTRVRIVFDASAHPDQHLSLNDCLFEGSDINIDLLRILLNFRKGRVACVADMQKAFLQIKINEEDRDVLRYFWVDPEAKPEEYLFRPKLYRMTRVTFGINCSPYLLHQTLKVHCEKLREECDNFAPAIDILLRALYVDDIVFSGQTDNEVNRILSDIQQIMERAGFSLHKVFVSTSASIGSKDASVLGLGWNQTSDQLFIKPIKFLDSVKPLTKRQAVRQASRLFDPMGMLSPISIQAKFFIQELWKREVTWDQIVPEDLISKWCRWKTTVEVNNSRHFPRFVFYGASEDVLAENSFYLHLFADASPKAYGVAAYVVYLNRDGCIESNLLMAKFRVAPIHELSLPRLELTAALMAALMFDYLKNNFVQPAKTFFWTDSKAALGWIYKASNKTGTYVINRVKKIRNLTVVDNWQHCATEDNPADFSTRPQLNLDETGFTRWWKGPNWTSLDNFYRTSPQLTISYILSIVDLAVDICMQLAVVPGPPLSSIESLIKIDDFSTYSRLIRVSATVLMVVDQFLKRGRNFQQSMVAAEILWIYSVQAQYFRAEQFLLLEHLDYKLSHNSPLIRLRPFLDIDNLIRLQGRLQRCNLSYDERHPIVLPAKARFTQLLIDHTHKKLHHAGVSTTLTVLRQKYWILSGRRACRAIIQRCLICSKFTSKKVEQPIAPLPPERVEFIYPFSTIGLDFAGPAYVKGRSQFELEKAYIALFTCAASRAIHLEIVSSLSAGCFLLALRRFIARRGPPTVIFSDNALQFKRAAKDLEDVSRVCATPMVKSFCESEKIEWRWIAERAPWWGGFWERLVRSIKEPLRRVLGNTTLTFEELETVVVEIEAIVNSRPLAVSYDDIDDLETITPAHLLLGRPLLRLNPDPVTDVLSVNPLSIYVANKRVKEVLVNQWRNSYLLQLRLFHTGEYKKVIDVKVGDVVLLLEDDQPRYRWKLCRILEVIPGRDGIIRSCHLKTMKGQLLRRPVNLLAPLEFVNNPIP